LIKFDQFLIMGCGTWLADHSACLAPRPLDPTQPRLPKCPGTARGLSRAVSQKGPSSGWVGRYPGRCSCPRRWSGPGRRLRNPGAACRDSAAPFRRRPSESRRVTFTL